MKRSRVKTFRAFYTLGGEEAHPDNTLLPFHYVVAISKKEALQIFDRNPRWEDHVLVRLERVNESHT